MEPRLSRSERELLKVIYRINHDGSPAHTSDIASRLGVTAGTVTTGVKRLAEQRLIVHRPYRGVELTTLGRIVAIAIIRRHRIVERFLADMLGYDWQDSDRLAAKFEHHIPEEVEERMFETMGQPTTCPHGFPIPEKESNEVIELRRLNELHPGDAAVIALPGDLGSDVVAFLDELGVRPGAAIELREKLPFDGPIVVRVNGEDRTVGESLAARIHVLPGPHDVTDVQVFAESSTDTN